MSSLSLGHVRTSNLHVQLTHGTTTITSTIIHNPPRLKNTSSSRDSEDIQQFCNGLVTVICLLSPKPSQASNKHFCNITIHTWAAEVRMPRVLGTSHMMSGQCIHTCTYMAVERPHQPMPTTCAIQFTTRSLQTRHRNTRVTITTPLRIFNTYKNTTHKIGYHIEASMWCVCTQIGSLLTFQLNQLRPYVAQMNILR